MPEPQDAQRALTPRQAAAFIERRTGHRPHQATVWRWLLKGRLPSQRVGSRRFVLKEDLDAMLRADAAGVPGELAKRGQEAAARIAATYATPQRRRTVRP